MLRRFFAILAIMVIPAAIAGATAAVDVPAVNWEGLAAQDLPGVLIAMSVASLSALVVLASIVVNQMKAQERLLRSIESMQTNYVQLSRDQGIIITQSARAMTELKDVVERGQVIEQCQK